MIIRQTRILGLTHFASIPVGTKIQLGKQNLVGMEDKVEKFGFMPEDVTGTTILPAMFNKYSAKNAEPYYTIDRNKPKEKYTQVVYWTRHEWAGRGQTNPVTEFSYITRKRYHRDYHAPYSVQFTLIREGQGKILSEEIEYSDKNKEKIINTVNMILGMFGECYVTSEHEENANRIIQVNWDILPKGKYPWDKVKKTMEEIATKRSKTHKHLLLKTCQKINAYEPDFIAYGRAGFKGYAVFGFEEKNIFVLESVFPNNATYVFENSWEEFSKMTKAEILSNGYHKSRVVHNEQWEQNFDKIMRECTIV